MKYSLAILFTCLLHTVYAQYDTLYMAVLPFNSSDERAEEYMTSVRAYVTEYLSNDYRFVLVERDEFDAVVMEREYQKSEDFIDGRIVEQGKAIGAAYLLGGSFDYRSNKLTFTIYDVENGSLKCSIMADEVRPDEHQSGLTKLLTQLEELGSQADNTNYGTRIARKKPSGRMIQSNLKQLIKDCFPASTYWAVLRAASETNNKVKELLIAAGSKMALKKGAIVEVLVETTEEINGKIICRYESAGWGRVLKVESEYFSVLKLEAGAKNIKKQLKEGQQLKCRYVKK